MLDSSGEMGATGEAGARIVTFSPIVEEGQAAQDPGGVTGERLLLNAQEELTPIVTSVSPASGPAAGGNTVTITGKYLDSARNVIFGTQPATSWSVDLSGEHITAQAPASPASTVEVHVSSLHSTSEAVPGDRYAFVAPGTTGTPAPATPGQAAPGFETPTLQVSAFSESASRWRSEAHCRISAALRSERASSSSSTSPRAWLCFRTRRLGQAGERQMRRAQRHQSEQTEVQARRSRRPSAGLRSRRPRQGWLPGSSVACQEVGARRIHGHGGHSGRGGESCDALVELQDPPMSAGRCHFNQEPGRWRSGG